MLGSRTFMVASVIVYLGRFGPVCRMEVLVFLSAIRWPGAESANARCAERLRPGEILIRAERTSLASFLEWDDPVFYKEHHKCFFFGGPTQRSARQISAGQRLTI